MATDIKITDLPAYNSIDPVTDVIPVVDVGNDITKKINRNTYLSLSSNPVGIADTQTLTNKTLTSPVISGPVLSGVITGTYTLGGSPTFPSTVVTTTGIQTLTNKTLTSPTISGGSVTGTTITTDAIVGQTVSNNGTIYGLSIASGKVGTNGIVTSSITNSAVDYTKVATGFCVQIVSTMYSTVATGTTQIPFDNTIPQNTEGDQYMSQTITPKSATDLLEIQVVFFGSIAAGGDLIVALFQDSTANALAASSIYNATATARDIITINYTMTAGTTSPTTFKVRAGPSTSTTLTFNGNSGSQLYGNIPKSSIIIKEYKA